MVDQHVTPDGASGLAAYPFKELVNSRQGLVYHSQFVVTDDDLPRVLSLLATHASDAGYFTHHEARLEFGGSVIELVTNSVVLLQTLDAMRLRPPAPWLAFPDIDAGAIGSLQGSLDYWWNWLWMPYWNSASPEEREQLLAQASDDWREFFEFHV
ncbi:hypothetical protein [Duganella sp. S19_KUP01_CR8]|uniref:hypothetical protein n=1 Tax=Duganella sp. S19_KUP01_CR8 TaxID=3025502 RepID=UPI002FCDD7BA